MDYLFYIIILIFVVFVLLKITKVTDKGKLGEAKVSKVLSKEFSSSNKMGSDYYVINDVLLKEKGDSTQIDHLIISKYGIFVIETKNYSGKIFGYENQKNWTQYLRGKKYTFQNPHRQNYKHVKFLSDLLGVETNKMLSLVVFVGDAKMKNKDYKKTFRSIKDLVLFIKKHKLRKLTNEQVFLLNERIKVRNLNKDKKEEEAHIKRVQKRIKNAK